MLSRQQSSRYLQLRPWLIFSSLSLLITLVALNGCGSNMQQGPTASFAFVTNTGSGTVSAFAVSTSGALSPVSGGSFPAGAGAEFMAFDSVHKLLFVNNQGANTVSAFS